METKSLKTKRVTTQRTGPQRTVSLRTGTQRTGTQRIRTRRIREYDPSKLAKDKYAGPEFDLSNIPDSTQFGNANIERRLSFYWMWVFCCWLTIGICFGIFFGHLIIFLSV